MSGFAGQEEGERPTKAYAPAMAYETVLYDVEHGVATITLNRPEKLNAISDQLATDLEDAVRAADADDGVRAIVLTGAGKGFCSGLDLTGARPDAASMSRKERLDEYRWVGRIPLLLVSSDKPVIAALNGPAAGAGLSFALAADIRVMAEGTRLTTGYGRRGLSPDGGMTFFLPRLVGQSRATELVLTSRWIDSAECERIGLVSRLFPAAGFREHVAAYASEVARGAPVAMTYVKRLLAKSATADLRSVLRDELVSIYRCFETDDVREGMMAFAQKRTPEFKGK
jgi:2-(1,2-epoxy-1,2-dihydrophenyl)acetyl-CoA isomerase